MLVVFDLGNSAVKLGAFEDDRLIAVERFEGGPAIADGVIPSPLVARADVVVVGSSAPEQLPVLLRAIERPARVLGDDVRAAVATSYERPEELGIDRLAAAWGARAVVASRCGGGETPPVVVVDVGTAVTVDAVDAAGRFLAVAIAPGVRAAAAGLARAAPHLPLVAATAPPRTPATGTLESLQNGLVLGMAGLVERLIDLALEALTADADAGVDVDGGVPQVVLTGGGATLVASHVRRAHTVAPECVLHGLRALHLAVPPTGQGA